MAWLPHQQQRLAWERQLLRTHMPDFSFWDPLGRTYIYGGWQSQKGNYYTIRIDIPAGYPDECPKTYVEASAPLFDYLGSRLTAHGTSHTFHTWDTDRPGVVQICTFRPFMWSAANTTVQLLHKSFLWIIAYEEHRATGKQISDLLLTM